MFESLPKPLRSMSPVQLAFVGLGFLILIFLFFGTANDASSEPTGFGLQTQSFLVLAFLAFAGGVLSFASPCTLPILPAYFAFAFQSGRKQIALNTISFMLGLATMFSLMGATASAFGRLLRQNQGLIILIGGSLVVVFGVMSLLGKGFSGVKDEATQPERTASLGGSYVFGLTFAVGWSSCVGPILGTVLTMAATTNSIARGMMLLFIYALGLGLPLVLVSTIFGRASRQSLFWRILRGKGWEVNTNAFVVGLIWALAIWRILVAVVQYFFFNGFDVAQQFTLMHEFWLLAVAIGIVGLWIMTGSKERKVQLFLHSTQLVSGVLFIAMGLLMLSGRLATFNSLVPPDLAIWFADLEDVLISMFN